MNASAMLKSVVMCPLTNITRLQPEPRWSAMVDIYVACTSRIKLAVLRLVPSSLTTNDVHLESADKFEGR